MTVRKARSFCRICCAHCGVVLSIDDERNQIVDVKADKDNPMSNGYVCFKGLQAGDAHHGEARLLRPLKRQPDGSYAEIDSEQALDEIAAKLKLIIDRDGPRAVAAFKGTQGTLAATNRLQTSFLDAIGSDQFFSVHTVDQSSKSVSFERQGGWAGGPQSLDQSEVLLFFGANPVISHSTMPVMSADPLRLLKRAKERGLKLICIDPRFTETARHADIFLQALPGRDALIAAAIIRKILAEGWEDKAFVDRHVGEQRMVELRAAVEPFGTELAERCAGLEAGRIDAVAAMFARDSKAGAAFASTGPSMSPFSNLAQHLVDTLNIICGRFRRAGDLAVTDMAQPPIEFRAEVIPPQRSWEAWPDSRIRGVGMLGFDRLSSTLPEEIMTPGPGRIRAMLVQGGNPALCLPDEPKVQAALRDLELLVTVDPYMSATARFAHYVLPPTMMYERPDLPMSSKMPLFPVNWTQYTPAAMPRPEGSDLIEDWYLYWALARRLGLQLIYYDTPVDMEKVPATEDLLRIRLARAQVTLDQLKSDLEEFPAGRIYEPDAAYVKPARPGAEAKFHPMPADVAEELAACLRSAQLPAQGDRADFTHLLVSRRLNNVMNTVGSNLENTLRHSPHNPAFLHPDDLGALGLEAGDRIEIASRYGRITAFAEPDNTLRPGVLSISHCWGGSADAAGVNVNALIRCDSDVQPINAMPHMSAVPISIRRIAAEADPLPA